MLSVTSGSTVVSLTYDALGRMVEQQRGSSYQQVVYGPTGDKLALMNGQSLVRAYVPLPGGAEAVYNSSGLAYYRHADWLGSSRLASTPARTVYYDTSYAPYGENYQGSTGTADLSFTGQDQDTIGGLYDFMYRRYSPGQGRWVSPDPTGLAAVSMTNPQTWNRYAYVGNSPLTLADPLGLAPCGPEDDVCVEDSVDDIPLELVDLLAGGGWFGGGGFGPDPGPGDPGGDQSNVPANPAPTQTSNRPFPPCDTASALTLDYFSDGGLLHIEQRHMKFLNTGNLPYNGPSQYAFENRYSHAANVMMIMLINAYTFEHGTVSQSRGNHNYVFVATLPPEVVLIPAPDNAQRLFIGHNFNGNGLLQGPIYTPTNVNTLVVAPDCKTVQTSHPGPPK